MAFDRLALGRLGAWAHLDTLPIDEARDFARRADQLGYGTLWVPETVGRDPMVLLGLLAGATTSIKLGTGIVSIWGRDAETMRMSAMTLQEATAGRLVLGLGVSHPHLAEKLRGHAFDRPLTRMREYLAAYRSAIYKGPMPAEAVGAPPIVLAALRERMLGLAAAETDGAFPYLVTSRRVAEIRAILDGAVASADAPRATLAVSLPVALSHDHAAARAAARAYLAPYLRTPTYHASWTLQGFDEADWQKPGSDRLVEEMVVCGGVELVRARVGEMLRAGADHVALIPLAADGTTDRLATLEALAE
ncbi:MAG TPA: LLM class flavin-dependent oxidoreductase [Candidatus Limnocylindria bacterium]|nr:LLM class flavin-dependent oxidoreductase [Candidatus Limnocylindria bacterium]